MPTLYVSDLDGTLLAPDGTLSETTIGILGRLLADGILFSYATARSYLWARRLTAQLVLTAPVVVHNGAFVVDPRTGEAVVSRYLGDEDTATILETSRRRGETPLAYTGSPGNDQVRWVQGAESPGVGVYLAERPGDPRLRPAATWDDLPTEKVFAVTLIGDAASMHVLADELRPVLGGRANLLVQQDTYHPDQTWLEIASSQATKASGVRRVQDLLGARRLVVFGDNVNDLPMFAIADEAYAVANAVEQARRAAGTVIGSNAHDGVAAWLRDHHDPRRRDDQDPAASSGAAH